MIDVHITRSIIDSKFYMYCIDKDQNFHIIDPKKANIMYKVVLWSFTYKDQVPLCSGICDVRDLFERLCLALFYLCASLFLGLDD